VKVAESDMYL